MLVDDLLSTFQTINYNFVIFQRHLTTSKQCLWLVFEHIDSGLEFIGLSGEVMYLRALGSSMQPIFYGKCIAHELKRDASLASDNAIGIQPNLMCNTHLLQPYPYPMNFKLFLLVQKSGKQMAMHQETTTFSEIIRALIGQ